MSNLSFQFEPAMWIAVCVALLDVLIAFGVPITPDQKTAVIALADAVIAIVGGLVTRSQVTPTAKLATPAPPVVAVDPPKA